ncbi:hypothetical protein, partial [Streptomyces cacaoi]
MQNWPARYRFPAGERRSGSVAAVGVGCCAAGVEGRAAGVAGGTAGRAGVAGAVVGAGAVCETAGEDVVGLGAGEDVRL